MNFTTRRSTLFLRSVVIFTALAVVLVLGLNIAQATAQSAADSGSETAPGVLGFDHVGLVVQDLDASRTFFTDVLGFSLAGSDIEYPAHFLKNGPAFVTLWQATDPKNVNPFDRKNNIGLHHMALAVASEDALNTTYRLAKAFPGVVVEFAPELSYGGPSMHMMIYEPGGNRIEIIYRVKAEL